MRKGARKGAERKMRDYAVSRHAGETAETIETIRRKKVVAIVRGLPSDQLEGLTEALLAGGIGLVEVTFARNAPQTWQDTARGIRMIAEKFAGRVLAGAGTVLTQEQLCMAYEAGARYIISPGTDEEIIRATKGFGMVSIPGALSPSEICRAHGAGADFVKVFPAGCLGPDYIRAVKAPLSHIELTAVGGVDEKNAADFLAAGASCIGVGGNLVRKDWIAAGQWERITELARAYTEAAGI